MEKPTKVRIKVKIDMVVEVPPFNASEKHKLHGYAVAEAALAVGNVVAKETPNGVIQNPTTWANAGTWTVEELPEDPPAS